MIKKEEISKLKKALMEKIKSENDSDYIDLSVDEITKIIFNSSHGGKYILWVLKEYLKGNIQRFEDMGRVRQSLTLFKNNLSKFTEQQKQLNKLSFQELETLVEPYQDVLTQNAIKRMSKEKIWEDIEIVYEGPEGKILVPKSQQAAIFLGQGTKWCTAAVNNNMFDHYNKKGSLYIFIAPEKDERGRETKYQFHFETGQFMNAEDENIDFSENNKQLFKVVFFEIFKSISLEKIIFFSFVNDIVFDILYEKHFFEEMNDIIDLKKKMNHGFISKQTADFWKHKISENLCFLDDIPNKFRTKEICEIAIEKNENIICVPDEFLTEEFCEFAIKKNGKNLLFAPKKFRTKKNCEIAVRNDGISIGGVDDEFMNKELCELAVRQNGLALNYIPDKLITYDLCKTAILQTTSALHFVPEIFKTEDIYSICLDDIENINDIFLIIPEKYLTQKICEMAVRKRGMLISKVPKNFLTKELCEFAVINSGESMSRIPENFLTIDLCKIAVKNNKYAFKYIPEKFKTPELCEIAICNGNFMLGYLPKKIYEIAIFNGNFMLEYLPIDYHTREIYDRMLETNCVFDLDHMHDDLIDEYTHKIINFHLEKNGFKKQKTLDDLVENVYLTGVYLQPQFKYKKGTEAAAFVSSAKKYIMTKFLKEKSIEWSKKYEKKAKNFFRK